jgi:hypothetical protein
MIIKKLAAPLINEKILHDAEHCYIATASITEAAFDFVKSRLHPKCKIDIVTGLDAPTSPEVLKRIWRHYQERITLHVYTKNFFHPNVYIFDLPFRKAVAFVGSGHFTLEGLKDHEEVFYKIKDPKEIEALKSWFIGYYEFAEPLTDAIITEYNDIYPSLKRHEIAMQKEKEQFMELATGGFQWDSIKFKNQYVKKEDYLTLSSYKASHNTPDIQAERIVLKDKLLALRESVEAGLPKFLLGNVPFLSSLMPVEHTDQKIKAVWTAYSTGNDTFELNAYPAIPGQLNFMQVRLLIRPKEVSVWLLPDKNDRIFLLEQLSDATSRNAFFKLLMAVKMDSGTISYWIEVAGKIKGPELFQNEDQLWEFIKSDAAMHYTFIFGKSFSPGAPEINTETIGATLQKEIEKLMLIYQFMRKGEK